MRYTLILASLTALASSVAAIPHARAHMHAHHHRRNPEPAPTEAAEYKREAAPFTPRVTATGATVLTLKNGDRSVSHLEQTLGISTGARQGPAPTLAPSEQNQPAGSPVRFSSNPSTGGPPTHDFEVIVNEPYQPGPNHRDYPGTILLQTNFHRNNQSAPTLIWGFALQRTAQDIANKCVFEHDL